jgi:hypothetical protein
MIETQIKDSLEQIQKYAENALGDSLTIHDFPLGCHIRQGDVYLSRIESFNKNEYELTLNRQLAEGNTKGASHTVDESVKVWKPKSAQKVNSNKMGFTMLGPIIESDTRFSLLHPEHSDFSCPSGIYQVSYQIDPQTMSRVLD